MGGVGGALIYTGSTPVDRPGRCVLLKIIIYIYIFGEGRKRRKKRKERKRKKKEEEGRLACTLAEWLRRWPTKL